MENTTKHTHAQRAITNKLGFKRKSWNCGIMMCYRNIYICEYALNYFKNEIK